MGAPKVTLNEIDQSQRVPQFPGAYGGIALPTPWGLANEPVLVTSEEEFLRKFMPQQRVDRTFSKSIFSALAFLEKSNKLWVSRAVSDTAEASRFVFTQRDSDAEITGIVDLSAAVTTNRFTSPLSTFVTAGLVIGDLIIVEGFVNPENNGTFVVTDLDETFIEVHGDAPLVDEIPPVDGTISAQMVHTLPKGVTLADVQGAAFDWTRLPVRFVIVCASIGTEGNSVSIAATASRISGARVWTVSKQGQNSEVWNVSLDSTVQDGNGKSVYLPDVLGVSELIRAIVNPTAPLPGGTTFPTWTGATLADGVDGTTIDSADLIAAVTPLRSKVFPLTMLLDGGVDDAGWKAELVAVAEQRKDCVAILSVPSTYNKANFAPNLVSLVSGLALNTSYAAIYGSWVKIYDKFNDREILVSPDGFVGAALSDTITNFEPWYPVGGLKRGKIAIRRLDYYPSQGEMDLLYDSSINCITKFRNGSHVVWGQKTLWGIDSALDRLNVRMLLNVVEIAISDALNTVLFELNDSTTRAHVRVLVSEYMENIKARHGVYAFSVVCDETNNLPQDIDSNRLVLHLYIQPTKSIEEVQFNVVLTRTGAAFSISAI